MDDPLRDVKERVLLEGQKAYIIINAVGALALLVFLQAIWSHAGTTALKKGVLSGILAFALGVVVAMLGYAARDWSLRRNQLNSGILFQVVHLWIPAAVAVCFLMGVILPVIGGYDSLPNSSSAQFRDTGKRR